MGHNTRAPKKYDQLHLYLWLPRVSHIDGQILIWLRVSWIAWNVARDVAMHSHPYHQFFNLCIFFLSLSLVFMQSFWIQKVMNRSQNFNFCFSPFVYSKYWSSSFLDLTKIQKHRFGFRRPQYTFLLKAIVWYIPF